MRNEAPSATGYWERAEQMRAQAGNIKNPATKRALLDMAAHYERLAHHILQSRDEDDPNMN